jgi:integrase
MGKVRVRKETGKLQFDFFFKGMRCREQTLLEDTPENRKRLETFMAQIDREIKKGTFSYEAYFPNSANLARLAQPEPQMEDRRQYLPPEARS